VGVPGQWSPVPNSGNGIAFDRSTGDAYVAQYADGRGHQATPGFIVRVPASAFKK
jgi:hypothetical protein